ncbi:MAG: hypothetical protein FWC50_15655, partial [Planctomycetaceae bacterium]|nr:hypothetical protein [Planctomycetaceae bacterium]
MANDQATVDAIKNALTFSDTTSPETIRTLAEQYALACRELNKRMSYCGKYLHEGNVAEAIRLAEMEPNLLDAYNILDFEERKEWTDVVATLAFPVPPPLMTDFVHELNDAYSSQQLLEPYLRKYRIAALARAPLADRLAVLRTIVQLDPNNLSWVKDQESLEKVRLVDLEAEAAIAVRTGDFAKLLELQAECRQNWSIAVPASVTEKIDTAVHRHQMTEVTRQMQDQAELLLQAHAENNVEKAKRACDNLRTLQEWNRLPVPKSIAETTQKAVDWLQNEQKSLQLQAKFETTKKQIQNALQKETSQEELSRLHDSLATTAAEVRLSIPEEIEKTYRQKIGAFESRRRRRLLWIATGVVMLCIFLAGAATLLGVYFVEAEKTRQTTVALDRLLEEAKTEVIREYLAKNEKTLMETKNGEIVKRVAKLAIFVRDEDLRTAEFETKRKSLGESLENGDVSHRFLLDQLERLATTADEKQSVETLRERLKQIDAKEKISIDSKLQAELSRIQNEIQAVDQDKSLSREVRIKRYGALVPQLEKAFNESTGAGKPLTERCRKMIDTLNAQVGTLQAELALKNRIATLLPLVGNAELFKGRLKEIADSALPKEQGEPFVLAWQEFPASETLLKYGVFERRLKDFQPNGESANKDAPELVRLYEESAEKIASLSGEKERLIPFLKTLAKRPQTFQEQAALFSGTREILTRTKLKPVWALFKSPADAWYYVTENPDRPRTYSYLTGPSTAPAR